jgi:hypothetical protein
MVTSPQLLATNGFGPVGLHLDSWAELYPADRPRALQNMETYGACPGSPDPNNFVTHGLNIRAGKNGHSTLYVVGHGAVDVHTG